MDRHGSRIGEFAPPPLQDIQRQPGHASPSIHGNGRVDGKPGRLDFVPDWPLLARQCRYAVARAAEQLQVSTRWLEIYFKKNFCQTPHEFFALCRLREVRRLARSGLPGKTIARLVGLANFPNLCRTVKRQGGRTLTELRSETMTARNDNRGSLLPGCRPGMLRK